jgi:phenylacetic acid degradation operon negative regulatory protein
MKWEPYHHPDLSLPVLTGKLGGELLDFLSAFGDLLFTRGVFATRNRSLPNRSAYHAATYRLRKRGLIAYRRTGGASPVLVLTREGFESLSEVHHPEKYWRSRWNGIWYVLVFDVPEKDRGYRNALRGFLSRMRLGCLQRSVWVTPRDIRPQFADLVEASALNDYAHLFESRTVLGRGSREIVESSWDFERLHRLQKRYLDVYGGNFDKLKAGGIQSGDMMRFAREEMSAYRYAMYYDPLLPSVLWPQGYGGDSVWALHNRLMKEIRHRWRR